MKNKFFTRQVCGASGYAMLYGMDYQGMATNKTEAQKLAKRI